MPSNYQKAYEKLKEKHGYSFVVYPSPQEMKSILENEFGYRFFKDDDSELNNVIRVFIGKKPKIEKIEKPKNNKKFKRKKFKTKKCFYSSKEWKALRYKALLKYGHQCLCCGNKPPHTILHVDHIKPRSKFPQFELDINNLQILCEDCNLGKSNKDFTDFRD